MGILNLTGDSFYEGSRLLSGDGTVKEKTLLSMAEGHIRGGATILDVGAFSSRPGSEDMSAAEQLSRLLPSLRSLKSHFPDMEISVDTTSSEVVGTLYDEIGPFTVNDISAAEMDRGMLPLVGKAHLPYIAMHMRGTPKTMSTLTDYGPWEDRAQEWGCSPVTAALVEYFRDFGKRASEAGVRNWILDPGFGFAKSIAQNYDLLRELPLLRDSVLDDGAKPYPLLVGLSRKSMAYRLLGITPSEALPATQVLHYEALRGGADILRVHDCAEATRTIAIYRQLAASH